MYLEKAIFVNRAPFEKTLTLDFKEKGINVLTAINGKGKTTILSHITDAFYEMARDAYKGSFEGKEDKYYRFSSTIFNMDSKKHSIVYLRFGYLDEYIDYIDYRGKDLTDDDYKKEIPINNPIPYNDIIKKQHNAYCIKFFSDNLTNEKSRKIFGKNVLTFFPAYRYEQPFYLNDPYKFSVKFDTEFGFGSYLINPIEVTTGVELFSNWIMDVVLDWLNYKRTIEESDVTPERTLFRNANHILSSILSSKYPDLNIRFGIGKRINPGERIGIMHYDADNHLTTAAPNIRCLSSGELALLCLFGELLRQGDKITPNVQLAQISGIVLVDEVDMHLHIKLQNEILPKLFNLFPNVQFIVSSHSPFLNMGLAEACPDSHKIFDLDNDGHTYVAEKNDEYLKVYNMMVNENQRYAELYNNLVSELKKDAKPLIITEGKTDIKHLKAAIKHLGLNLDIDFYEIGKQDWGDSKLKSVLDDLSLIKQTRTIIGIFDRDDEHDTYVKYTENGGCVYKQLGIPGSNVYAFCIPVVNDYGDKISIEHYYRKQDLLKTSHEGRRIFLGEEFYISGNSKDSKYQTKCKKIDHKVKFNGVIDSKVFESTDLEQKTSVALTKDDFAELVLNTEFANDFDFSSFNQIFSIIEEILALHG